MEADESSPTRRHRGCAARRGARSGPAARARRRRRRRRSRARGRRGPGRRSRHLRRSRRRAMRSRSAADDGRSRARRGRPDRLQPARRLARATSDGSAQVRSSARALTSTLDSRVASRPIDAASSRRPAGSPINDAPSGPGTHGVTTHQPSAVACRSTGQATRMPASLRFAARSASPVASSPAAAPTSRRAARSRPSTSRRWVTDRVSPHCAGTASATAEPSRAARAARSSGPPGRSASVNEGGAPRSPGARRMWSASGASWPLNGQTRMSFGPAYSL